MYQHVTCLGKFTTQGLETLYTKTWEQNQQKREGPQIISIRLSTLWSVL